MILLAASLFISAANPISIDAAQTISVDQSTFTVLREGSQATVIQISGSAKAHEAQRVAASEAVERATGCRVARQYSVVAGSSIATLICSKGA